MENISAVFEAIKKQLPEIEYRLGEPMKNHTSFKIGGNVTAMFFPRAQSEIILLSQILRDAAIKPLIIGNGTNILAEDGPLDLLAIKTHGYLNGIKMASTTKSADCSAEIIAESGVLLSRLAVFALDHALTGLEFAHGIPGTFGGAVSMNAGAYGGEIKDVATRTTAIKSDGIVYDIIGEEHGFSYRYSRFSETDDIILCASVKLTKGNPEQIKSRMDELSKKRRESQPLNLPSAGSTFKRPHGGYAAALIDAAGLKGYAIGGAMVSAKHAGFLVNRGDATFKDVMSVMDHIRETVFKQFAIELEPEVKIIRSR